jgi:hypothetical protein
LTLQNKTATITRMGKKVKNKYRLVIVAEVQSDLELSEFTDSAMESLPEWDYKHFEVEQTNYKNVKLEEILP